MSLAEMQRKLANAVRSVVVSKERKARMDAEAAKENLPPALRRA